MRQYLFTTVLILISALFCQFEGLRKSVVDDRTSQTFDNFRSDSTQAVFYQVLVPDEFIYDAPKNNANAVYRADKGTFAEVVLDGDSFTKIRVLDKFHGLIEGWMRTGSLKRDRFYGRPLSEKGAVSTDPFAGLKKNPFWIRKDSTPAYADSALSAVSGLLEAGDIVYVEKFCAGDSYMVNYKPAGGTGLTPGYVKKDALSEFALIKDASTDVQALFDAYDPAVLEYGLDRAGFISYKGISFRGKNVNEFTEDIVCREQSADTLNYRWSLSTDINDIKKASAVRNSPAAQAVSMFRYLPDENIVTSRDTVKCRVVELVLTPRSAKVVIGGIEENEVKNTIVKLHIARIEKHNTDIVFQKETDEYFLRYKRDPSGGRGYDVLSDTEKTVKRLVAFRKH